MDGLYGDWNSNFVTKGQWLSSTAVDDTMLTGCGYRLGEVGFTTTKPGRSLIPQYLTGLFELICRTHHSLERALEMFCQIEPVLGVDVEPFQDRWQIIGYRPMFVFSQDTARPVYQLQVIVKTKGQALGHVCSGVANKWQ